MRTPMGWQKFQHEQELNRQRRMSQGSGLSIIPLDQGTQGPDFEELSGTLMDEIRQQEELQAQEFARRNAQIAAFGDEFGQRLGVLDAQVAADAANFAGMRDNITGMFSDIGDQPGRVETFDQSVIPALDVGADRQRQAVRDLTEGLKQDGRRARAASTEAVQVQREALSRFDRDHYSAVENAVAGLEQRAESFLKRAGSTRNPDGSLKSPAAMQAEARRAQFEIGQNAAIIKGELTERWRNTRAALSTNLSAALQSLSNTEIQIAQLNTAAKGQAAAVEGDIAGRKQRASEVRAQLAGEDRDDILRRKQIIAQVNSNLFEVETSQRGAALTYAVEKVMEGNVTLYNMILQNPNSMISKFTGLLALRNISDAETARAITPSRPGRGARPAAADSTPATTPQQSQLTDQQAAALERYRERVRQARLAQDQRNMSPARRLRGQQVIDSVGIVPRPF